MVLPSASRTSTLFFKGGDGRRLREWPAGCSFLSAGEMTSFPPVRSMIDDRKFLEAMVELAGGQ